MRSWSSDSCFLGCVSSRWQRWVLYVVYFFVVNQQRIWFPISWTYFITSCQFKEEFQKLSAFALLWRCIWVWWWPVCGGMVVWRRAIWQFFLSLFSMPEELLWCLCYWCNADLVCWGNFWALWLSLLFGSRFGPQPLLWPFRVGIVSFRSIPERFFFSCESLVELCLWVLG